MATVAGRMIPLALNILCAVGFGHVMKWAERQGANPLWVAAYNYLVAGVLCAGVTLLLRPTAQVPFTLLTGAWGGVCYLVSLLYYFRAVVRLGVGQATSAIRLAVAVPVAVSLLVWHEPMQPTHLLGLGLTMLALPLLGRGRTETANESGLHLLALMAPLFLVTGLGQLAARVFSGGAPAANTFLYLSCLFVGAALSALVALGLQRVPPRRRDLRFGLLLGALNVVANLSLLLALRVLPSAVVFAVSSAAGVVLAAVTGVAVWRERLSGLAWSGVVLAAVAVVLLVH